jgi:hypothetical protein
MRACVRACVRLNFELRLEDCTILDFEPRLPEFMLFSPSNSDSQSVTHTFLNFELHLDVYTFRNFDSDSQSLLDTFHNFERRPHEFILSSTPNSDSAFVRYLSPLRLRLLEFIRVSTLSSDSQTLCFSQLRTPTPRL